MNGLKSGCFGVLALGAWSQAADLVGRGHFFEPEAPFVRSALVMPGGEGEDRIRRGVLLPLGEDHWACFDPDLLRWAALWKVGQDETPITLGTMASVSYPWARAKANEPPFVRGDDFLTRAPQAPGVTPGAIPEEDPREAGAGERDFLLGPLPSGEFRWEGIELRGDHTVLRYRCGDREIHELLRRTGDGEFERLLRVGPGEQTLSFRVSGSPSQVAGGRSQLPDSGLPYVAVLGAELASSGQAGTFFLVPSAQETTEVRVYRSRERLEERPDEFAFPELRDGNPAFSGSVMGSSGELEDQLPLQARNIELPHENPWERSLRPTDLAFLSDGTALVATLDGDVWRVKSIDTDQPLWTRAATGIFEPIGIVTDDEDRVFIAGRDQVTELIDHNDDGWFDEYRNASDAFQQTLNTRDYLTSLEVEADGSFLVAKGGIHNMGTDHNVEMSSHRGTVVRLSPDGRESEVLADGLRMPYVGLREDGAVFASDQQGHFVPSTPIFHIGSNHPSYGFRATMPRDAETTEPMLWFPYQVNRSGAGFGTLAEGGFPDLDGQFVQVSWNGRLFPVVAPSAGRAFAWRLPLQLDFPALHGASHPVNGRFYTVGIGISAYNPTTPEGLGVAEIRQKNPLVRPERLDIFDEGIELRLAKALDERYVPAPARIRLWNIKRSAEYGSGHFRLDGEPGEHVIDGCHVELSEDRSRIRIALPGLLRADILEGHLLLTNTDGTSPGYPLEFYTRPADLPEPDSRSLEALVELEGVHDENIEAGDPLIGEELFTRFACAGCHSLSGEPLTGPDLGAIGSREMDGLRDYLKQSILEPHEVITEGYEPAMPSFSGVIPAQDLEHLLEYLLSLK